MLEKDINTAASVLVLCLENIECSPSIWNIQSYVNDLAIGLSFILCMRNAWNQSRCEGYSGNHNLNSKLLTIDGENKICRIAVFSISILITGFLD